jgi:hypothetical protein
VAIEHCEVYQAVSSLKQQQEEEEEARYVRGM